MTKAEQPRGVSQKPPYLADLQAARRYTRADHAPGRDGETPHALHVVSANLLHGFDPFNLQNALTGDFLGEWSGDEASTMLGSLAYASD